MFLHISNHFKTTMLSFIVRTEDNSHSNLISANLKDYLGKTDPIY